MTVFCGLETLCVRSIQCSSFSFRLCDSLVQTGTYVARNFSSKDVGVNSASPKGEVRWNKVACFIDKSDNSSRKIFAVEFSVS